MDSKQQFLFKEEKIKWIAVFISIFVFSILTIIQVGAQTVNSWVTNANQSALLQQQAAVNFAAGSGATISINSGTTYQIVDGYGFCLTEGSAEAISTLTSAQQTNLLNDFFSPSLGIGVSVIRISIGASDLSSSSYSYDDAGPDASLTNFSLAGPDLNYLIPLLKRILVINPNIKILATPWSAPRWMKTNNAWIGGSLNTSYYTSYANYFVKYINAMKAQGINIWAVTPQNEPENPYNEPSMTMNSGEETNFINNNLGPAFSSAGITTKIIVYDHNLDDTNYPTEVLNGSSYADGAAFHLYAGDISGMTTVHNATGKNVYFTEQYTSTTGGFSGDFPWHMQNVMIGSMNNWGRTSLEWNLATDASYGPHTGGGCTTCLGAVTISNSSTYTKNVSYYIVGQLSKFVQTGAVRIQSSSSDGSLQNTAFKNPDGSIVLVVFNSGASKTFTVGSGSNTFSYTLAGSAAASFVWSTSVPPSTGIVTTYGDCNFGGFSGGLSTGSYTLSQLQALGISDNDISSMKVRAGYKALVYENDNFAGASYTITADNSCLVAAGWNDRISSVKVLPNGVTGLNQTFYIQNRNSGLYLNVSGAVVSNGTPVIQWSSDESNNEQFAFTDLGSGVYKIIGVKSGRSLDIAGMSTNQGAVLQIWDYGSTSNQQFIVAPTGDGFYKLIPTHSNQIVEVKDASTAAGYTVQQWNDNGQTCGQWKFIPVTSPGTGNGLAANYFNGMNFESLKYSSVDATINVDWGTGSPNAAVNSDGFSARWTGQVQSRFDGDYTFYLNSDNGRRLWINNQLIVDKWLDDWGTEYSGTITLTAGQKYEIKLEYFEDNGGANCKLEWSSFLQTREVIPQSQLYANGLPTVSITSPVNNASFNSPASITINATASDSDGSVAKVDFYNGTTLMGTDSSSPFSYTWSGVTAGSYDITALATDNRGGEALSSGVTVKVNQPPTVSITAPSNNSNYVASANITFTATAADVDGSVNKVEYFNGTTSIGSSATSPYTINWTNVGIGTYTITAQATDNSGAVTTSSSIAVKVNANQLPVVSITTPSNNATFIVPSTVSLAASASDADGTITKVDFYNGSTLLGSDNSSPYTYDWTGAAAGSYTLTAKATDDKLGVSTSAAITVVISNPNQAPSVALTSPVNNSTYTTPASLTIEATASDPDGTILKVEFYNGTTKLGEDNSSPYTYDWSGIQEGTYDLTVIASDNEGATTTSAVVVITVNASIPTAIHSSETNDGLILYPNPVVDELIFQSSIDLSQASIQIIDVMGRVVYEGIITTMDRISLESLETGAYTLIIITNENKLSKSFVKY